MAKGSCCDHRNNVRRSQLSTKGRVPLFLTALFLVTSCSTSEPTSVADTATSAPAPSTTFTVHTAATAPTIVRTVAELDADQAIGSREVGSREEGFTSLFVGHSFFDPVAMKFYDHALRAGFGHTQERVMAGGGNGAPEALWNDPDKRSEILTYLMRGDVDLFGMTYHPDYPSFTGYRLWVEEALSHNPQTAFFVGMPWARQPESMTATDYALTTNRFYETLISPIVDQLKTEFPDSIFFAIPYGQAASDLYVLFEAGQASGIRAVVGDPQTSLFTDALGHTFETIVEELATLVWLRAIYCVDLFSYSYPSNFSVDLASIGMSIVAEQRSDDVAPWCREV
jgi:hypothetical protein